MAWTYSGDPSSSTKDAVRFEIGDTDEQYQLLQDGEIVYALAQETTVFGAAARCAEAILAKLSKDPDKKIGPTDIKASQRVKHFAQLAKRLRAKSSGSAAPSAPSLSVSQKLVYQEDTELTQPSFRIGMQDDPNGSRSDWERLRG